MKNSILPLCVLVFSTATGFAQAYEGTIEYEKKKQPAIVIEYSYPTEAVEAAIVKKMERMGYKGREEKGLFNKDKGFRVYKAAIVADISSNSMDYIIDVERKSRKEKDESILYLIINKNGENLMTGSDATGIARAKEFLDNMIPEVEASNLELQIKAQEEGITKSEKKLKGLRDDQDDLEKKIKNNQKDQENTQKEIESQKKALEALKAKRKNT